MLFVGLVAVQVLVVVGMAAGRESTLRQEETDVKLQTVPVDPRDLFRGDYVVLRYDISTLRTEGLRISASDVSPGATVYVALVEGPGGHWVVSDAATVPLTDRFLRGTVTRVSQGRLDVEYGLEQYFVPEGEGLAVERASDVDVVVAIDDAGHGVIRHLVVDGEVWDPYR
jgi:uncharacterized membrane-anchored protein